MTLSNADRDLFLAPTAFIDSDASRIREIAADLTRGDPMAAAVALFDWVRDEIRYDPRSAADSRGRQAILGRTAQG